MVAVNVVVFVVYGIDKMKAKKGLWRISEAMLLGLAVIGGLLGAWAAMNVFQHKIMTYLRLVAVFT